MGISKGISPAKKGRVGDLTYFERNGRIVVRQRQQHINHSVRTTGRMGQRVKYGNVVGSWRSFLGELKGNFELKKDGQTDYNAYLSVNLLNAKVFLTREEAGDNVCVVDNFVVSQGNLQPAVEMERKEGWWESDIAVGDFVPEPHSTVGHLMGAILRLGGGRFMSGDELQVIRMRQEFHSREGKPSVSTECELFTIDSMNGRPIGEMLNEEMFSIVGGRLALKAEEGMLVAIVQRRWKKGRKLMVTTQNLVGENDILSSYTSEEALHRAIESYDVKGNRVKQMNE